MQRHGQLGFSKMPAVVGAILLMVLFAAASSLAITSFQSGTAENSTAQNITGQGNVLMQNFSAQWPVIGTMLGVGLLITIVFVALGVFIFQRGNGL